VTSRDATGRRSRFSAQVAEKASTELRRGDLSHTSSEQEPANPSVWLTRAEAAAYARCSLATIDRAVRLRELRSVVLGGDHGRLRRFRREWLDEWLAG
jgi:excisionase family DNA binding protein